MQRTSLAYIIFITTTWNLLDPDLLSASVSNQHNWRQPESNKQVKYFKSLQISLHLGSDKPYCTHFPSCTFSHWPALHNCIAWKGTIKSGVRVYTGAPLHAKGKKKQNLTRPQHFLSRAGDGTNTGNCPPRVNETAARSWVDSKRSALHLIGKIHSFLFNRYKIKYYIHSSIKTEPYAHPCDVHIS